ncbi:hypothetical protein MASR2M8_08840 [Opitutaceae bacterium]
MRSSREVIPSCRRGFALVLVVVVLGFLVLIVVALATHLRIEQAVALRRLQVEQARRHALTGLSLAIGQLQAEAGPDRRATAGAPMLGTVTANKTHWVGVWVPDSSVPRWLVSSSEPDQSTPASALFTEPVVLVGPASAEVSTGATNDSDQVRVDAISLAVPAGLLPGWNEAGDPVIGRTAYWVGDESGKLPAVVRDERPAFAGEPPSDPWPRLDLSGWWGGFDFHATTTQGALAKVLAYGQLGYVDSTVFSAARLRRNFHRTTVVSRSVLSNPAGGGLKQEGQVDGSMAYGTVETPRYDDQFYLRNPPAGTDPDDLPVARFSVLRPTDLAPPENDFSGARAAAKLLVSGGVNLNAIDDDVTAQRERWRAILSATRTLRFPDGGVRTLSEGELDALASQMTALRFRAGYPDVGKAAFAPFSSVGQFARSGLLQAAINATLINQDRTVRSADYIDQADLLAMLAPILVVRSDTFLVRAYGEVRDPFRNESLGEVWCEAVVQRLPDYVDAGDAPWDPPASAGNQLLGRRFVVESFRWLTAADL